MTVKTGRPLRVTRLDHRIGVAVNRVVARPFFRRPKFLLVLSTMRAGTSLVTNVLMNNPEIAGFGESHIVYDRPERLLDLRYWIARYNRGYPGGRRVLLDKVLHTEYTPDLPGLLNACDPHVLFLVRDPAGTGKSLRRMYEELQPETAGSLDIWAIVEARYRDLARLLSEVPEGTPVAALSYEALLEAPEPSLARITAFLGLRSPLSSNYDIPRWGGRWGLGDGGEKIRSGRIEPQPRPAPNAPDVPENVSTAYSDLLVNLSARCAPAVL